MDLHILDPIRWLYQVLGVLHYSQLESPRIHLYRLHSCRELLCCLKQCLSRTMHMHFANLFRLRYQTLEELHRTFFGQGGHRLFIPIVRGLLPACRRH